MPPESFLSCIRLLESCSISAWLYHLPSPFGSGVQNWGGEQEVELVYIQEGHKSERKKKSQDFLKLVKKLYSIYAIAPA